MIRKVEGQEVKDERADWKCFRRWRMSDCFVAIVLNGHYTEIERLASFF
jgi:hypothetical protein